MAAKPNFHGPGLVGPNGVLSPTLVNFLLDAWTQLQTTQATAEAAAEAAAAEPPAFTVTGINGVRATSLDGLNYVVDGLSDQQILASQIFGP
jgi:hypothetical protein